MAAKTLIEAFEVKNKTFSPKDDVVDYDIFRNKNLLEELRTKIVQNLVEENIPSDELMERFVRGDSSRNTEGSGLGLSIAQSLTELMQGSMKLEIDGDLFKVILKFNISAK